VETLIIPGLPYYSQVWDASSIGIDAFTAAWPQGVCYAFPPVKLVLRTLEKAPLDKAHLICPCLLYMTALQWLELRHNIVGETGVMILEPFLAHMKSLKWLDMDGTAVYQYHVSHLDHFYTLPNSAYSLGALNSLDKEDLD
jgi:hypothetical protein